MPYADDVLPRLEALARRAAERVGVEVAWVELKSEGPKWFFRVFIDRDSGVGLSDCEKVTERLSVLLDVEDPIDRSYTLEVSTPGLDRPLWTKRDYQRFTGRLARVKTAEPLGDRSRFLGRLAGVEDDELLLDESGQRWRIPLSVIQSGRLEVELFQPQRGRKLKRSPSRSKARRRS